MFYIIQENTFRESNYNIIIETMDRLGLDYDIVKSVPFTDLILHENTPNNVKIDSNSKWVYKNERKDIFVFGSLKLARVSKENNWISLMNSNHDYDVYKHYWKENLLNWDSEIVKFNEIFRWDTDKKFIRPCEDTKVFTGKVFTKEEWKKFVFNSLTNGVSTILNKDTRIQVCSPKTIYKEIRCWIVDKKVITASQYMLGGKYNVSSLVDEEAIEFAQSMVDIFQLADAFVIDICLTPNGWKIVEAGCINCTGFYNGDMQKVIMSLENYYNKK